MNYKNKKGNIMLMENFTVLGFYDNDIYFIVDKKTVILNKRLPKEDMILSLKVAPEDVKSLRNEILVQASKKRLTFADSIVLSNELNFMENQNDPNTHVQGCQRDFTSRCS